jgi:hypothetical protein
MRLLIEYVISGGGRLANKDAAKVTTGQEPDLLASADRSVAHGDPSLRSLGIERGCSVELSGDALRAQGDDAFPLRNGRVWRPVDNLLMGKCFSCATALITCFTSSTQRLRAREMWYF